MAAIAHAETIQTTGQTHTGDTNWTTKVTLSSASFVADKKYLLICTAQATGDSASQLYGFRLAHGAAPTVFTGSTMIREPAVASAAQSYGYMTVWDVPNPAVDVVFQLQTLNAAGKASADTIHIFAMRLDADLTENLDWVFGEDTTVATHTTAFQTFASIAVTPGAADEDWLILAAPSYNVDNTFISAEYRINSATAGVGASFLEEGESTSEQLCQLLVTPYLSPTAAAHTFTIQGRDDARPRGAQNQYVSSRIFALRLDAFADHGAVFTAASQLITVAFSTFTEMAGGGELDIDPGADTDVFLIGYAQADVGTQGPPVYLRIQQGGTTIPAGSDSAANSRAVLYDPTDESPMTVTALVNVLAADPQQDFDLDASITSVIAARDIRDTAFAVFSMELSAAAGAQTLLPDPVAIPILVPAPTVSPGTLTLTPDPVAIPINVPVPTVTPGTLTLTPAAIAMPIAVPAPTVSRGTLTLTPDAIAIPILVPEPLVEAAGADRILTPDPIAIPIVVAAPTVTLAAISLAPDPVAIPILVPDVTVTRTLTLTPAAIAMPIVVSAPTVTKSLTLSPDAIAMPIQVPAPTITAAGSAALLVGAIWRINTTEYPSDATYQYEVALSVSSVTDTATALLFNVTDGVVVAGSSVSTSETTETLLRSGSFTLASGEKDYRIELGGTVGSARWHSSKGRIARS